LNTRFAGEDRSLYLLTEKYVCVVYYDRKPFHKAIQAEEFNHNNNACQWFKGVGFQDTS